MNNKFSFIDLDGTLLNKTKKINNNSLSSLKNYTKNGGNVVICTGRWPISSNVFNSQVENFTNHKNKYLISLNGAYIEDLFAKKVIFSDSIPNDVFEKLLLIQKRFKVAIWIYSKRGIENKIIYSIGIPVKKIVSKFNYGQVKKYIHKDNVDDPKIKILFMSLNSKKITRVYRWLKLYFSDYLSIIRTSSKNIEITNKNIDKGSAIRYIKKIENIDILDTYGFGDSGNDVPMFKEVGNRFCFSEKNLLLNSLSNYSFKSNKFLPLVINNIVDKQYDIKIRDVKSLSIQIDNVEENTDFISISKMHNFWTFVVEQKELKISLVNYPNWFNMKLLSEFKINNNCILTSDNNNTTYSFKEKKFIFSKSFSDTQVDKIQNYILENNIGLFIVQTTSETCVYYLNENELNQFFNKLNINKYSFNSIIKSNKLLNNKNILSFSFFNHNPNKLESLFVINNKNNLYFLMNVLNNKNIESKFDFRIKTLNNQHDSLKEINNYLLNS